MMKLRVSEWIAVAYFGYLACAAFAVPLSGRRRRDAVGFAAIVAGSVVAIAWLGAFHLPLRDWAPVGYVLLGYWIPALLVTSTNERFERMLLALDHRWFGDRGLEMFVQRAPRSIAALLEAAYLFCYPMVPLGLACLYAGSVGGETDRFWTAVLLAVFPCYGLLPWLPARPPRVFQAGEARHSPGLVRQINLQLLGRASIQLNTFPSGHVAASVATALAVGARLPDAGVVLGLLAVGIAVGSVVGRYHYAADALAGAALAALAFMVSRVVA